MTPGLDNVTLDGVNEKYLRSISDQLRSRQFKFKFKLKFKDVKFSYPNPVKWLKGS